MCKVEAKLSEIPKNFKYSELAQTFKNCTKILTNIKKKLKGVKNIRNIEDSKFKSFLNLYLLN